jgi:hypothetical protein
MVAGGPSVVPMLARQVGPAKLPAMAAAAAASCTAANPRAPVPRRASGACNGLYGGAGPPGERQKRSLVEGLGAARVTPHLPWRSQSAQRGSFRSNVVEGLRCIYPSRVDATVHNSLVEQENSTNFATTMWQRTEPGPGGGRSSCLSVALCCDDATSAFGLFLSADLFAPRASESSALSPPRLRTRSCLRRPSAWAWATTARQSRRQ